MSPALPDPFLRLPIAHRALHDVARARPENSLSAVQAAIDAGYGIEIDLQLSSDGEALVFHDYDLDRLTGKTGAIQNVSAAEAAQIPLLHGRGETIPTLAEVLAVVAGQVPVLIELKNQSHLPGGSIGPLERTTAAVLDGYVGPVAVMSFNPDSVIELAQTLPNVPRGLTTYAFDEDEWPITEAQRQALRDIRAYDQAKAAFISHDHLDLDNPAVRDLHAKGVPILCWTIRSAQEEALARRIADNVTFEGYAPSIPA